MVNCRWDASSCSPLCCPRPLICLGSPLACQKCYWQFMGFKSLRCLRPTPYTTPYKVRQGPCQGWNRQIDGKQLASFQRVQGGRWNHSLTNTKLHPIISECKSGSICEKSPSCRLLPAENRITFKQAGNIYRNTAYEMPKAELKAYLANNRAYLWR
jgi:hypothetical protein